MERCLAQACTPLLEMICCWLFEGRLASEAGDFFILSNPLPKGAWPPFISMRWALLWVSVLGLLSGG